jgi:hypothetical protein
VGVFSRLLMQLINEGRTKRGWNGGRPQYFNGRIGAMDVFLVGVASVSE